MILILKFLVKFCFQNIKQSLKQVNVRKTSLTKLIINSIRFYNLIFDQKKHLKKRRLIDKLTLFLPKNYNIDRT